ncbi:MAG: iron-containing alcohol dehydrogenase, partial [Bacillota bacterium]|nr:iron-containing alcohol dehydrogenase [Bacillota bacterium]
PVAHGQCVAAMMGPVMEYNWKGYPEKFARIAKAFGIDTSGMSAVEAAKAAVNWMYQLVEDLEIPSLEEQGVSPDMIDRLSKEAMKDPQTVGNPRDLNEKAYNWIYKRCFNLTPKTV